MLQEGNSETIRPKTGCHCWLAQQCLLRIDKKLSRNVIALSVLFRYALSLTLLIGMLPSGCAMPMRQAAAPPASNPLFVQTNNEEMLWERTIDVLHTYLFEIEREDRFGRVIETQFKVGSGVLEPWHHESVGLANRLESSLQSIRRKVLVYVTPAENGTGYFVTVEAVKQLEDLQGGLAANSTGAATFSENKPLKRDLNYVVGQTRPSGWIPKGRDLLLEAEIISELRAAYSS